MKKSAQITEISVFTPEQSTLIKPIDWAILSMISEAGPDLTRYLKELLRTIKQEQKSGTFWLQRPEHPEKTEETYLKKLYESEA